MTDTWKWNYSCLGAILAILRLFLDVALIIIMIVAISSTSKFNARSSAKIDKTKWKDRGKWEMQEKMWTKNMPSHMRKRDAYAEKCKSLYISACAPMRKMRFRTAEICGKVSLMWIFAKYAYYHMLPSHDRYKPVSHILWTKFPLRSSSSFSWSVTWVTSSFTFFPAISSLSIITYLTINYVFIILFKARHVLFHKKPFCRRLIWYPATDFADSGICLFFHIFVNVHYVLLT